jgi:hypothetical protein
MLLLLDVTVVMHAMYDCGRIDDWGSLKKQLLFEVS